MPLRPTNSVLLGLGVACGALAQKISLRGWPSAGVASTKEKIRLRGRSPGYSAESDQHFWLGISVESTPTLGSRTSTSASGQPHRPTLRPLRRRAPGQTLGEHLGLWSSNTQETSRTHELCHIFHLFVLPHRPAGCPSGTAQNYSRIRP